MPHTTSTPPHTTSKFRLVFFALEGSFHTEYSKVEVCHDSCYEDDQVVWTIEHFETASCASVKSRLFSARSFETNVIVLQIRQIVLRPWINKRTFL